jgi:hypothetical protein
MATASLLLPLFFDNYANEPHAYLHWKGIVVPIPSGWRSLIDGNHLKLEASSDDSGFVDLRWVATGIDPRYAKTPDLIQIAAKYLKPRHAILLKTTASGYAEAVSNQTGGRSNLVQGVLFLYHAAIVYEARYYNNQLLLFEKDYQGRVAAEASMIIEGIRQEFQWDEIHE